MTRQLDNRTRDAIDLAVEIEQEDAKAAGGGINYLSKIFCQLSLPHSEPPPNTSVWIKTNGSLTLRLRPGVDVDPATGTEHYGGFPYGKIPRYLLIWICSTVVTGHELHDDGLTINLGDSMAGFLRQLGIQTSSGGKNGSVTRVRDQVLRLATSSVLVTDSRNDGGAWNFRSTNFAFVDSANLLWSSKPAQSDALWPSSSLTISQAFRDAILASSVPLSTRSLRLLQRSPSGGVLALDLYTWLVHRMYSLRRPTTIPWEYLSGQFGNYSQVRQFRARVVKVLPIVSLAYPEAKIRPLAAGLELRPSPLSVSPKPLDL